MDLFLARCNGQARAAAVALFLALQLACPSVASGPQNPPAEYELRYSIDGDLCRASQSILPPYDTNATKAASNGTPTGRAKRIDWAALKVGTPNDSINQGAEIPAVIETDIDNDGQTELVLKSYVWMRQKPTAQVTIFEPTHPFYVERSINNLAALGGPNKRDDLAFNSFPQFIAQSKIARIPTTEELGTEPGVPLSYTVNVDVDVITFANKNYFLLRNANAALPPHQDPATVFSYDGRHNLRIECVFIK